MSRETYFFNILTNPALCDDEYIDYTVSDKLYKSLSRLMVKKGYLNRKTKVFLEVSRGVSYIGGHTEKVVDWSIDNMIIINSAPVNVIDGGDLDLYTLSVEVLK